MLVIGIIAYLFYQHDREKRIIRELEVRRENIVNRTKLSASMLLNEIFERGVVRPDDVVQF